jgi:Auxiliary Activity family 9 (formerly GH61)
VSLGGAEFYPSCTQIRVGGSQTGTPNQTVLFPGAYSDTDPGVYDPSVYSPGAPYIFPGPPVSNLASLADMTGKLSANGSSPSSTSTGKIAQPTSTNGSGRTSFMRATRDVFHYSWSLTIISLLLFT